LLLAGNVGLATRERKKDELPASEGLAIAELNLWCGLAEVQAAAALRDNRYADNRHDRSGFQNHTYWMGR
jgi:hypothetical protein